jgi:hypothetical protein
MLPTVMQDALRLQDVVEPELSLEEDLRESINRVFHASVAHFQVNQARRMTEMEKEVKDWVASEEKKDGKLTERTAFIADEHLKKFRISLHEETWQYMAQMKLEEMQRNEQLQLFILLGHNSHD